jgi:hypothetical protein
MSEHVRKIIQNIYDEQAGKPMVTVLISSQFPQGAHDIFRAG